jgi:RNA methyltransferase, TrmH family
MELTSLRNPLLQRIRRAAAAGRPTEDGLIVAEGPHLLEELKRGAWPIQQVFVSPPARQRYRDLLHGIAAEIIEVSERALASTASTETPQHVVTLVAPRTWSWRDLLTHSPLLVVLDRMQDPGNVGTIVRSAEAFGATGVVLLKGSAHVANGKLLRASAGSIFRMPVLENVGGNDLFENLEKNGVRLYALAAQAYTPIAQADLRAPCALLVGSEGSGIAPELLRGAEPVSIPSAHVESLNAAVACSVALYAAHQQRCAS